MIKVFIDGSQGTTGLRLKDRLMERKDIELLTISEEERKSLPARAQKVAEADVAFLCLPDAASRELVETVKDVDTKIIDTSTAFRCDDRWAYGFPELGFPFWKRPKWQPHQRSRLSRQRVCRYRAAGPDGPCLT